MGGRRWSRGASVVCRRHRRGCRQRRAGTDVSRKADQEIVPTAAGGPTDVRAPLAQQILPSKLGQRIVIENRPAAGGAIGARDVAAAPAEGYTLMAGISRPPLCSEYLQTWLPLLAGI